MKTQAEYTFQVRSYECGPDGFVTLANVCNYLQEAASLHAEQLQFSMSNFRAEGQDITWVLTRLRVSMTRFPRWNETVTVMTFPCGGRRITANRDFVLRVGSEQVGIATSEWMVIDLASRRIVAVPPRVFTQSDDEHPRVLGEAPFSRLRWDCRGTMEARTFTARRGDIDLNGHVNNVRYIEWLLETMPPPAGGSADFEIVFHSETLAGEAVRAESAEVEPGVWAAHVSAPNGHEHAVGRFRLPLS